MLGKLRERHNQIQIYRVRRQLTSERMCLCAEPFKGRAGRKIFINWVGSIPGRGEDSMNKIRKGETVGMSQKTHWSAATAAWDV